MQAEHYILLLYRNRPSVVIGRNQNPWTELNVQRLREVDVHVVRRRSGGGTVYHDLGNSNYFILGPRASFQRSTGTELVSKAIRKLGVPAYVNERHDICVEQFKVSGSAFKIGRDLAYHHGTMLIDAALHDLKDILRNTKTGIESKGVASVSSPVRNIEEWSALIDHDAFVGAVASGFSEMLGPGAQVVTQRIDRDTMESIAEVRKGAEDLSSWSWLYGQTPEFKHSMSEEFWWGRLSLLLHVRQGLITSVSVDVSEDAEGSEHRMITTFLERHLPEDRYGTIGRTVKAAESESLVAVEVVQWLLKAM